MTFRVSTFSKDMPWKHTKWSGKAHFSVVFTMLFTEMAVRPDAVALAQFVPLTLFLHTGCHHADWFRCPAAAASSPLDFSKWAWFLSPNPTREVSHVYLESLQGRGQVVVICEAYLNGHLKFANTLPLHLLIQVSFVSTPILASGNEKKSDQPWSTYPAAPQ